MVAYELTMPRRGSWNGKWSREDYCYIVIRRYNKKKENEILEGGSYYYDFGDGWAVRIFVSAVDSIQARKLRRKSNGFYGYEWMIDSIEKYGFITDKEE